MRSLILICVILFLGCSDSNQGIDEQSMQGQQAQYQAYLDHYDKQNRRADMQLEHSEKHMERYEALLKRWEEQADRFDRILDKWESQTKEGRK
jgi:multidrug resistance efflux pump